MDSNKLQGHGTMNSSNSCYPKDSPKIHQSLRGIFINQAKYAQEILKKHGMTSCDSIGTPIATKHLDADLSGIPIDQTKYRSKVRALMYLTASRPDIMHATCYCARYQVQPTEKHLTAVKRIFRYLKDTIHIGLWYPKETGFELTAFSNSDHAGCLDSCKSTSGGIQFLGGDKLVSWLSKKQDCTSMSFAKAEYVSLSACYAQVLWMRTQLTDCGFHFDKIPMYCDSKAAITISCNPVQHSHTKHIDVRYHFIKENVEKGIVELFFVGTKYQLADLFTKALPEERFKYLIRRLEHPSDTKVFMVKMEILLEPTSNKLLKDSNYLIHSYRVVCFETFRLYGITLVLSPDFKLPDESQVLLRVPRENNMYNVNLKNIVPSGDLTCLFAKATINESNLWHRRVLVTKPHIKTPYELLHGRKPSIGFMRPFGYPVTILNTLDSLGKFEGKVDEGFLVGYAVNSSGPTWLFNIDSLTRTMNYQPVIAGNQTNASADDAFDDKEHDFDAKKPKSEVILSPSSKFEDYSDNSSNEVNAAGFIVPIVRQNSLNSTNTFSAAGPSNAVVSPTYGKSSFIDTSYLPDDQDMPELEDITYPDDEDVVSAEADFNNLESAIPDSLILTTRIHKDHHVSQIIGDLTSTTQTRSMIRVVKDQVDLPHGKRAIGTKWVYRNKKDERGIVVRNKARLVTERHTHKEGINYKEVFAPVARIEAIRLFLAYSSFMGFMVCQMDVKSAFLYGTIEEEVYICQPSRFEDPDHPDKVYKVVKELYGLHQAPRAWYETLATYLLENSFQRGIIYQTLFIKKQKGDILLVQIYVDDIIFGATNKDLCKSFEKLMKDKFQMSSMGELTFFLGLQVKQKKDGIFISQDKYVAKILRKFRLIKGKSASTPIDTEKPLMKDPDGEDVDVHTYRSMIGSLMYLTSSRPDIMFAVCACARFQVTPKASHLHAVKRIFRYLKGKPHLGLWYPKDSPFDLVAYSDSDYAGASLDRKSTTEGCQFLGCRLISLRCKKQTVVATYL
nr:hypothetical protein [Tanacetum cinerariifolium]